MTIFRKSVPIDPYVPDFVVVGPRAGAFAGDIAPSVTHQVSQRLGVKQGRQGISTVTRQVCFQPHSGSQYASLASASRRISSVDFPLYMLPVCVT